MRLIRWACVVFLLLLSLSTWVPHIRIAGITPDLLYGVVFVFALRRGAAWGVWLGVALGLLIGVEEPAALGRDSAALALAGLLVGRGALGMDRTNPFVLLVLLFGGALVADTARAVWGGVADPGMIPLLILRWALPGALYTILVLPILAWVAGRILGLRGLVPGAA